MLKNYLKIAFRIILKQKGYALINIIGLSIGLAACSMMIIPYIMTELSYDKFHTNASNSCLQPDVGRHHNTDRNDELSTGHRHAQRLPRSGQCHTVSFDAQADRQTSGQTICRRERLLASIFDIFTLPMISGDDQTAFSKPYSVVINEEMAGKYFYNKNPLGKVLTFNNEHDFIVTGVMKTMPKNTHRELRMLCSFSTLCGNGNARLDNWLSFDYSRYILLKETSDYQASEQKFPALINRYIRKDLQESDATLRFYLNPLTKLHLYSHVDGNSPGLILQIFYYSFMAIFIVIIVCIDYMNPTTVRSGTRAKEVGHRKVVGAQRHALIKKFLSEALIITLLALLVAFMLTQLVLMATLIVIPLAVLPIFNIDKYFPYVSDRSIMININSAVLVFLISLGTITFQSIRTAMAGPVEALHYK